jgi:hypothetical protein
MIYVLFGSCKNTNKRKEEMKNSRKRFDYKSIKLFFKQYVKLFSLSTYP